MLSDTIKYLFPDINFLSQCILRDDGTGPYIAAWNRPEPRPTQADIDAATPAANAAVAAAAAEQTQLQTDKAAMKTAYTTAVTRLQAISTATFANNGQRDAAIQDLAKYLLALAKVARGLL